MVPTALLPKFLVCAAALCCGAAAAGPGKPQPHGGNGLKLTLTVVNPSTVEGTLFLKPRSGKAALVAVVHPGASVQVTAYPGQKYAVYFLCHDRRRTHTVPSVIADEWRLPGRPCG